MFGARRGGLKRAGRQGRVGQASAGGKKARQRSRSRGGAVRRIGRRTVGLEGVGAGAGDWAGVE